MNNYNYEQKNSTNASYIFIDGISRSGKGALAPLISSIPTVEHFKSNYNLDKLFFLYETKSITKEGFIYSLQTDLIKDTWFTLIGRDQNNNKHDLTSILNSSNVEKYKNRENRFDNDSTFNEILDEIKKNKLKFPYITDDFVFEEKLIKKYISNSKFIVTLRNPFDLIFSWERSGRGYRYGKDDRFLHPSFSINGFKNIPYFAIDDAENYTSYSSLEKCVFSILKLQNRYLKLYKKKLKHILWVTFEDLLIDPNPILYNISKYIDFPYKNWDLKILNKVNLPRNIDVNLHKIKTNQIFGNINENLKNNLLKLCNDYIKLFGNTYSINYSEYLNSNEKFIDFKKITPNPKYIKGKRLN